MVSVITGLFLICSIYMVRSYQKEFVATNQLVVDHYAKQMNKDMEMLREYTDRFSVENIHLQRLKQKKLSEFERIGEEYYLKNALENKIASLNFKAVLFYYETDTEKMHSAYSGVVVISVISVPAAVTAQAVQVSFGIQSVVYLAAIFLAWRQIQK